MRRLRSIRVRRPAQRRRAIASRRPAFTLVEVIVAMALLVTVLTAMGVFSIRYAQAVTESHIRSTASDLATARLEDVKGASQYSAIDGFAGTEASVPGEPKYTRITMVRRVGGRPADFDDYKVVTVEVSGPGLTTRVSETTIISSF